MLRRLASSAVAVTAVCGVLAVAPAAGAATTTRLLLSEAGAVG